MDQGWVRVRGVGVRVQKGGGGWVLKGSGVQGYGPELGVLGSSVKKFQSSGAHGFRAWVHREHAHFSDEQEGEREAEHLTHIHTYTHSHAHTHSLSLTHTHPHTHTYTHTYVGYRGI